MTMASDTTLMPTTVTVAPEPEILTLRTQLVSAGHTKDLLAGTAKPPVFIEGKFSE
jgi:hypothetical protein